MMSGTTAAAAARLMQERTAWRRDPDRPFGWWARLATNPDGSQSIMKWECGIPGPKNTDWEGGEYRIHMLFSEDYPSKAPRCKFVPSLFHLNVYPSGTINIPMLDEDRQWTPSTTMKQMLQGVFELLDHPNPNNPSHAEAYQLFVSDREEYGRRVRMEAKKNPPATA